MPQGQGRVAGPGPVSANSSILGKPHPGLQACHPQNEGVGLDSGVTDSVSREAKHVT